MEILLHWIKEHGFDLVGVIGIVASLGFTAFSFKKDESSRRIGNLLAQVLANRVLFGSHAPLFYFESALLKLKDDWPQNQREDARDGEGPDDG